MPAAIALAVAAEPVISVLFERGAFTPADTAATASALVAFSLGLPAFVLIKVFQPAFFAREDTRTPMWFAGVSMVVNVVGSLALFYWFKSIGWMPHVGIALATSAAGWVNAVLLWSVLSRSGSFAWDGRLTRSLVMIVLASVLMGAALFWIMALLAPYSSTEAMLVERVASLAALVIAGALVFFGLLAVTGTFQIRRIWRRS